MKRLIKNNIVELTITIEILSIYTGDSVSASTAKLIVTHPDNIKKKYRLTDNQIAAIQSIVDSVIATIEGAEFDVINPYQGDSYFCYIPFRPINEHVNIAGIIIKFAIIDHTKGHAPQTGSMAQKMQSESEVTRIVNLKFENISFSNSVKLLHKVKHVVIELSRDNIDVLDELQ